MKRKNNLLKNILSIGLIVLLIGALGSVFNIDLFDSNKENSNNNQETQEERIAVPNTGYVNKVYFNNNLSDVEIQNILSKLTYIDTPFTEYQICPLLCTSSGSYIIFVSNVNGIYYINYSDNFTTANPTYSSIYNSALGDFNFSEVLINDEIVSTFMNLNSGLENDKLIDLFYTHSSELIK